MAFHVSNLRLSYGAVGHHAELRVTILTAKVRQNPYEARAVVYGVAMKLFCGAVDMVAYSLVHFFPIKPLRASVFLPPDTEYSSVNLLKLVGMFSSKSKIQRSCSMLDHICLA